MKTKGDAIPTLARATFAISVLLFAFLSATRSQVCSIVAGGDGFRAGDWLINYGGGFVRRGLFGEVILGVTPRGQAALWVLVVIQVMFYAITLAFVLRYLHHNRYSWAAITLACAPAALPFIGWDPVGAFRKEIIMFAALALIGWSRTRKGNSFFCSALLWSGIALTALAVMSWEPSALMLPAVLYMLWGDIDAARLDAEHRVAGIIATLIALVGFAASIAVHGDPPTVVGIVAALNAHGLEAPALRHGAIDYIAQSHGAFRTLEEYFPMYLWYLPFAVLALLPIAVSPWLRRNWRWASAVAVGVAPLFFVALDYGRWIHILVMELTLCLAAGARDPADSGHWLPLPALAYLVAWGVPHWVDPSASYWPVTGVPSVTRHIYQMLRMRIGL